jgi:hypothetical protein
MILAVGFTSIVGEPLWALDTMPQVDAFAALTATVASLLPSWPSAFRPEDWQVRVVDAATLGTTVHFHSLANLARVDRAYAPDPKSAAPDTTGASFCRELTVVFGAVASDVVLFVLAFIPSVDDRVRARMELKKLDDSDIQSHSVAQLTDVLHAAKLIGESVRVVGCSDYQAWSGDGAEVPAGKLLAIAPQLASRIHHTVSVRGDVRVSRGEELPELRPA